MKLLSIRSTTSIYLSFALVAAALILLSNTLLFEGDYEFHHSNDAEEHYNLFVFQLSYGF